MVKMLALCTLITGLLSCTSTGKQVFQAPPPKPEAHTPSDKHAIKAVGFLGVQVNNKKTGKMSTYTGTAFPLKYKGKLLILSASHVCENVFNRAAIAFAADEIYAVSIIYAPKSKDPDLCVLLPEQRLIDKIDKENLAYELFEPADEIPEHNENGLIGYGWAESRRLIKTWHDVISAVKFVGSDRTAVKLRGNVYQGMSGGPLVDPATNKVVSVIIMYHTEEDVSYTVLPPQLKESLDMVVKELK